MRNCAERNGPGRIGGLETPTIILQIGPAKRAGLAESPRIIECKRPHRIVVTYHGVSMAGKQAGVRVRCAISADAHGQMAVYRIDHGLLVAKIVVGCRLVQHFGVDGTRSSALDGAILVSSIAAALDDLVKLGESLFCQGDPKCVGGVIIHHAIVCINECSVGVGRQHIVDRLVVRNAVQIKADGPSAVAVVAEHVQDGGGRTVGDAAQCSDEITVAEQALQLVGVGRDTRIGVKQRTGYRCIRKRLTVQLP